MHRRAMVPLAVLATLAGPAAAQADFPHVVAPSESLSSIAGADGLSVSELAAANGLATDAQLIAGTVLQIPPAGAGAAPASPPSPVSTASSASAGDGDADADDPSAVTPAPSASAVITPVSSSAYVVAPGDTLSAIAARSGMSVSALAAANGIDPNAPLLSGTVLRLSGVSAASPASPVTTPVSSSAYVVAPGDTLSAIAARAGVSVGALAAANGIDPNAPLLSGTVLRLSGVSPTGSAGSSSQPVGPAAEGAAGGPPYPTPERVSASQVGQVASANGVPPSLAAAVGWQESGFNNALVSSADARGVMQILPGTWAWIQQDLTPGAPLAPASALENVRGGVLLLHWLLASTGGDPGLAAAGYFQGLPSVRRYGVFPSTQQYVNDVLALRQQFGGP